MRYVAEVRFIASIYPGQLPVLTRYYGPSISATGQGASRRTEFKLEPVLKGARPFILPVHDSFEQTLDVMALSAHKNNPHKPMQSKPVAVEGIVQDLLNDWVGRLANVPDGCKPGVGEVHLPESIVNEYNRRGSQLPNSVTESKHSGIPRDEYDQLVDQQTKYFEYWLGEGELTHDQKKFKEISPIMRLAAEWFPDRPVRWRTKNFAAEIVRCPLCTSEIPADAVVCPSCRHQLVSDAVIKQRVEQFSKQLTA